MKKIIIINSYFLYVFLSILCLIFIFFTKAEASRIDVIDFSDDAVLIDFSELPNIHDYPSPITQYENISDIGVTFHVISEIPTFRTSGFDEGIGTNTDSDILVDAIVAVFSKPVLKAGAVIHISKAIVSAYDENNNLLEQHYASEVFYESFSNNVKEFVGIQNQVGIKKLVFEDVELNGRIIVIQDFIFEAEPITTISAILTFFDNSVIAGTLTGKGPGNSANGRLNALRTMIVAAKELIDSGNIEEACGQLKAAYKKCDSDKPDFVDGVAVPELSEMILDLMEELGCP